jgi:F-type H+-transporting ATPase subunit delta
VSMDLRGASAEALAALTEELDSHVGSGDQGAAARLADELFSVALTLRSEGALRRFATDASIPAEAKQGLVREVFGGRLGDGATAVLTSAVGRRWTATRDLADALEQLSVVALVRAAGGESGRLADELFAWAQAVKDTPELRDALSDPARSVEDKERLIGGLLDGKALPSTVTLAKQALSGSYRTVSSALEDYQRTAARVHGEGVATVRVARELTEAETRRLSEALSSQYGRPVHLNLLVDPTVLGGIRVEIGDDVIDGTVASRLDDARRRLAG